jgi:aminopeptidase
VPDPRVSTLAEVLCRYSLEVQPGDFVRVTGSAIGQPLFVELAKRITDLGAHPSLHPALEAAEAAYLEEASERQLATVTRLDELDIDAPDKRLHIWATENTRYLSGVPAGRQGARRAARRGLSTRFDERLTAGELKWVGTVYPCHADAQDAGMSLVEWEDFVYEAGRLGDPDPVAAWREQSRRQAEVAERLSGVRELRMVAEDTDLVVGVEGRRWLNADGRENFPDGEVYTSPVESRTHGHVAFTFDATYDGHDVEGVRLWFEDGRVVREEARKNLEFLREMLDVDDGARYLGEVAFGMNEQIQRTTRQIALDEKIGGTFHVALGLAFGEAGGTNRSGLHWDMICDLRRGGEVYGDGELIHRDGKFL